MEARCPHLARQQIRAFRKREAMEARCPHLVINRPPARFLGNLTMLGIHGHKLLIMKKYFLIFLFGATALASHANKALTELAQRLVGLRASEFEFVALPPDSIEHYSISYNEATGKISIEGSTPSAMAVAFNRYLRDLCHAYVSWYAADSINLPATLPRPESRLRGHARVPVRFFLNYCTYGYSMPYWKWHDWQRLIDWMALNGVNTPLALTGQEAVWQRVWQSFGLDSDSIRAYFTGPAHLPWHRMLNIDRWDGPLPQSYIDNQEELQHKILERERSLGMRPVLPAFAGHVPPELAKVYPGVKIHPMSKWGGMNPDKYRSYFIEPSEAVFDTIQSRFLAEQQRTFGTDHIYGLDPFNEIEAPSWEEDYLHSASARICSSLTAADPQAKWLQMAWMFYYMRKQWTPERIRAFLTGVAPQQLIMLDYYCDFKELWPETESFHGRPFIWCYLGNFGGNTFLVGDMQKVYDRTENAFAHAGKGLLGIGGTLEGLDANPHMHCYTLDRAWKHEGASQLPEQWIERWAMARGGNEDPQIVEAWHALNSEIYNSTTKSQGTLVNARPCFEGHGGWSTNNRYNYDNKRLAEIWQKLKESKADNDAHRYDVVNIGRQVIGNSFAAVRDSFTAAYRQRKLPRMKEIAAQMDNMIASLDSLLATNHAFSLDKWLKDARDMATDKDEEEYYRENALRLLTTWGEEGIGLNDYANRDMAGLTGTFYRERWRRFTLAAIDAIARGEELDFETFLRHIKAWEWKWAKERSRKD